MLHSFNFRVKYDPASFQFLSDLLATSPQVLPPLTRGHIINDAFELARTAHYSYAQVLDLSLFLANEDDYIPFAAATR